MTDMYPNLTTGQAAQPVRGTAAIGVGDYGIPTLSTLTVDGMPLDAVIEALRISGTNQPTGLVGEPFWSSAPRPNGDLLREVFEFSLSTASPVNQVNFALAHVPQRAWIQYRSPDGTWLPLCQAGSQTPVQVTILDSVPAVIPAGLTNDAHLHPQHFGSGHWVSQQLAVVPVTASRFRIIMARITSAGGPRATDGQPVSYSLGVRGAAVAYRVASEADLPWLPPADPEHTVPLAGGTDVLGSQVDYAVRRTNPANLLQATGVWRCTPQPVPQAVVSLFLDMRTATGDGQTIDRLYIEPLTSGPAMNVYYTQDDPVAERFAPADTPLAFPAVRPSDTNPVADGTAVTFDATSYLDIDNSAIHFDPRQPFLLAMVLHPQFTSADASVYTVFDNGLLTISVAAGGLTVALGERSLSMTAQDFGFNATLPLAVAFDGDRLTVRTVDDNRSQDEAAPPPGTVPAMLRLGGAVRMTSLFLAAGRAQDIDGIDAYWADPAGYALSPGYGADGSAHTSANAILRLDPSLVTPGTDSVCPWGLIGGPDPLYADAVWTPLPASFTLRKGTVTFRPILARHLKLEFTNLTPVSVVPSAAAPLVTVKLFPIPTDQGLSTVASPAQQTSGAVQAATSVALQGPPVQYQDTVRIQPSTPTTAPYLATESLYAPDPLDAQTLRQATTAFPYLPLPATTAARFASTSVHRYHTVDVPLDTKTAYSVSLNRIEAYASDPTAERDTPQYIELFHDTGNLAGYGDGDPTGWNHTGSAMVISGQPPSSGSRLASATYISRRRVTAVQIATQASEPQQLLADADFDDPFLRQWSPVGDASIAASDEFATTIGQMAEVTRGRAQSSWAAIQSQFPTWDSIESLDPSPFRPTWATIEQASSTSFDSGGIESKRGVTPPSSGRLYAAARVVTTGPLSQPLLLQIINGDGSIIAETSQTISGAQVAEFFVEATVRTPDAGTDLTWAEVADDGGGGTRTWTEMEAVGSWGDVTQDYGQDDVTGVRVRLVQPGAYGTDIFFVDSLALFADPVIWEVSRDGGINWFEVIGVRNDPQGVFTFPDLPPGDRTGGTQLRWRATGFAPGLSLSAVVLRPWYVSMVGGVPYHDSLQASADSTSLADYYPAVDQDPFWQAWSKPVPQWWWLASRQWQAQHALIVPSLTSTGFGLGAYGDGPYGG